LLGQLGEGPLTQDHGDVAVYSGTLGYITLLAGGAHGAALRYYSPNLLADEALNLGAHVLIHPDATAGVMAVPAAFTAFPPLPPVHIPARLRFAVSPGPGLIGLNRAITFS
jgi:hypothetical protein